MDRISGLPDELLVKILSLLPPKAVVSTSILSKRWESLWLWIPKLEFVMNRYESDLTRRDFITKNLSLLKPPVLESFRLQCFASTFQPQDIKHWIETSVSRCVRELDINYHDHLSPFLRKPAVLLPSSLYTCESLVTLKLIGQNITVDVPGNVDLPSLKTLQLREVTYSNEDSLRLLLSCCPVLEDLVIDREEGKDNVKTVVIIVPSLLRLSLPIDAESASYGYEIKTPSLKYFKVTEYNTSYSHFLAHMPMVEEVDLSVDEDVEKLFESITSVKSLSLSVLLPIEDEIMYRDDIVFNQLEHLKLRINHDCWAKSLVRVLASSPKLRVLKILNDIDSDSEEEYESPSWNNDENAVPECLLETLETFEFAEYTGKQEERDVVSYILKHARHLKSASIEHESC